MKPYMDKIFKEKGKRDTKHLYFNIKNKTKNLYKEIDEEGFPIEKEFYSNKESIFHKKGKSKSSTYDFSKLVSFLNKNIGRSWNDIYSEICKSIKRTTSINNDIFQGLYSLVHVIKQNKDESFYIQNLKGFVSPGYYGYYKNKGYYIDMESKLQKLDSIVELFNLIAVNKHRYKYLTSIIDKNIIGYTYEIVTENSIEKYSVNSIKNNLLYIIKRTYIRVPTELFIQEGEYEKEIKEYVYDPTSLSYKSIIKNIPKSLVIKYPYYPNKFKSHYNIDYSLNELLNGYKHEEPIILSDKRLYTTTLNVQLKHPLKIYSRFLRNPIVLYKKQHLNNKKNSDFIKNKFLEEYNFIYEKIVKLTAELKDKILNANISSLC